jgi:hypothetical protein
MWQIPIYGTVGFYPNEKTIQISNDPLLINSTADSNDGLYCLTICFDYSTMEPKDVDLKQDVGHAYVLHSAPSKNLTP